MEDRRKGTETTDRERLESMNWMEGQAAWRAGNVEKSKPGAERLRETAESGEQRSWQEQGWRKD